VEHPEQSFRIVREVGAEDAQPTLRPTPEAINLYQNLYDFDPSDRAAAERYRSQRMLEREEYDEVLTSVERRIVSVQALRGDLDSLLRRIRHSVRDVDYTAEVIPRLDDVLAVVSEQVSAEERFAEAVAEHTHSAVRADEHHFGAGLGEGRALTAQQVEQAGLAGAVGPGDDDQVAQVVGLRVG
jgi:hypothetical protein